MTSHPMLGQFLSHPLIADLLIEQAKKTPYFHLHDNGGDLYMGRYWLIPPVPGLDGLEARIHHIARPDNDRHLHDHPRDFTSVVLRGGYVEEVPLRPLGIEDPLWDGDRELVERVERPLGSIMSRRATDRHRIIEVAPDTWTLFITSASRQEWGFHTPEGKILWWKYLGLPEPKVEVA